jgi:hypothetical protein
MDHSVPIGDLLISDDLGEEAQFAGADIVRLCEAPRLSRWRHGSG